MEKKMLLAKCKPCSVIVKRLNVLEMKNLKKKNGIVDIKRKSRRWKRGSYSNKRKKKFKERERSVSVSTLDGDKSLAVAFGNDDTAAKNEAKSSFIAEKNNDALSLWKYKRKRSRSPSSDTNSEDSTAKKVPLNFNNTNLMNRKLQITLERLPINNKSILQKLQSNNIENNTDTDIEVESILSGDTTSCNEGQQGNQERATSETQEILPPTIIKDHIEFDEIHELGSSILESIDHGMKDEVSTDEDSDIVDNEDSLTDLCLMNETTVLITRLEDIMEALENNSSVPDTKYLSDNCLKIIRNLKYPRNMADDTSRQLGMSAESEKLTTFSDKSDAEESSDESDTDESYVFHPKPWRWRHNRRRISSDGSSSCTDDSSHSLSAVDVVQAPEIPPAPEDPKPANQISSPIENTDAPLNNINTVFETNVNSVPQAEERLSATVSNCSVCKKNITSSEERAIHVCGVSEKSKKSPKKSPNKSYKGKKHPKINPKTISLDCKICSHKCDSHEQLSEHIFKHTPQEHQDAYRDAKRQSLDGESPGDLMAVSEPNESQENDKTEEICHPGVAIMLNTKKKTNDKSPKGKMKKKSVSVAICACHTDELKPTDLTVQIEMVLYCEICKVLFRRSNCFETHYRKNAVCNQDRRKGRLPRLFCSTCRVVLNTLSEMRKHLEAHARINRNGTVTFVCNICRVEFFGVGTVFCMHWTNHEKDPMFIASQHSFPKLCVSEHSRKPAGTRSDEHYLCVAEYVCSSCKQQFSSEIEKSNHKCKSEEPKPQSVDASLPQNLSKDSSIAPKIRKVIASTENTARVSSDSPVSLEIDEDRDAENEEVIQQEAPIQNETPEPKNRPTLRPPIKRPPAQKLSIPSPSIQNRNSMNIWICDICNESFPNLRALGDHAPIHFTDSSSSENLNDPKKKNYSCTICQHTSASLKLLGAHWGKHDLMRYTCSVCKETFVTLTTFSRHIIVSCGKHNPTCRVSYGVMEFCKICQLVYKTIEDLEAHNASKHSNTVAVEKSKSVGIPHKSPPGVKTPEKTSTPVSANGLVQKTPNSNHTVSNYPRILPKTPLAPSQPTATVLPAPIEQPTIPLVLCVQPINVIEPVEQPPNNSYIINIAIPNSQTPTHVPDKVISTVPPQKIRTSEDPAKSTNVSAPLVTNQSPVKMVGIQNTSTFILIERDTTISSAEVVINTPNVISQPIITNNTGSTSVSEILQDRPSIIKETSTPAVTQNAEKVNNPVTVEELGENNSTSSDDILIVELPKNPKETSMKPNVPMKLNFVPKISRISTDSDIEIVSEQRGLEKTANTGDKGKTMDEDDKTGSTTDESSEGGEGKNLAKNSSLKPQGFLRVKKLAELQDETNQCPSVSGIDRNVNTLTEHLLASLETLKSPTKKKNSSGAPLAESNTVTNASLASDLAYMPGKRTLPYIPQRISGNDVRRANPLPPRLDQTNLPKPMNRVIPIATSNNTAMNSNEGMNDVIARSNLQEQSSNAIVNPAQSRTKCYTCPMCPGSSYDSLDKLINHLYIHPNMPPDVQNLVHYLMKKTNPQGMYQNPAHIVSTIQHPRLQPQPQPQVQTQQNSTLLNQNKYKCLICSAYETDSPTELQKHLATHSQQVQNTQYRNSTTSFHPQMISFNSFQSGLNQTYGQSYQYSLPNTQQSQAIQPISVPTEASSHTSIPMHAYSCNRCVNFHVSTYEEFQKHLQTVHNITLDSSERNTCLNCPQVTIFPNELMLKNHEDRQHSFVCNVCLQRFNTGYDLNTHSNLHHQYGQYNIFYSNIG